MTENKEIKGTKNEYGFLEKDDVASSGVQVEQSRAVQDVQAALIIAKKFPRNESQAFANIMKACERPMLAEKARYAYPRGGKSVTGATIRLAEVLKRSWGNMRAGIKEISREGHISSVKAYCWDLETNDTNEIEFKVSHWRDRSADKGGGYYLTEERDIYELIANQGARRKRACILACIPGDVVEAALERCKKTLTDGKEPIANRIRKMVLLFDEYGIKVEHLEKRVAHKLESLIEEELLMLGDIYNSLKDGYAKREDFFDFGAQTNKSEEEVNQLLAERKDKKKQQQQATKNTTQSQQSDDEFMKELNDDKK